jgi:hypothetical protein
MAVDVATAKAELSHRTGTGFCAGRKVLTGVGVVFLATAAPVDADNRRLNDGVAANVETF